MRGKHNKLGEGEHNKLGEGERKVRLGQDSLPNIAISVVAESSGNYIRCFTRTRLRAQVTNFRNKFEPGKPLRLSLMFVGKVRSLP